MNQPQGNPDGQVFDIRDWQSLVYVVEMNVGAIGQNTPEGTIGEADIRINDRTFILQQIRHEIAFSDQGFAQIQDGRYRIDWSKSDQKTFFKGPVPMADSMFGSIRHGIWSPLMKPETIDPSDTLNVRTINAVARPSGFVLQVQFVGIEKISGA